LAARSNRRAPSPTQPSSPACATGPTWTATYGWNRSRLDRRFAWIAVAPASRAWFRLHKEPHRDRACAACTSHERLSDQVDSWLTKSPRIPLHIADTCIRIGVRFGSIDELSRPRSTAARWRAESAKRRSSRSSTEHAMRWPFGCPDGRVEIPIQGHIVTAKP
jgi:hypothetical protein